MAVPAKIGPTDVVQPTPAVEQLTSVQLAAAMLVAKGYKPGGVAKRLAPYLYPDSKLTGDKLIKQCRMKLRRWRRMPVFKDAVYELALEEVEYATPDILRALTKQAKKGELNHSKFLLELTGRYSPKGDETPGNVTVVFAGGLPRPEAINVEGYEVTDGS